MNECCFNCAYCSESYPSCEDTCDLDGHRVKDAESEVCERFVREGK